MNKHYKSILLWTLLGVILMIPCVLGQLYVATGKELYRTNDDTNFVQIFNTTNYSEYDGNINYSSYGYGIPLNLDLANISFIKVSESGQYVYLALRYATQIYFIKSIDYGATFRPLASSNSAGMFFNYSSTGFGSIIDMDISTSGKYIYILVSNSTACGASCPHKILRSSDYGSTFSYQSLVFYDIKSLSTDDTGQYVMYSGKKDTASVSWSNNYGATFTTTDVYYIGFGSTMDFDSISSDGKYAMTYVTNSEAGGQSFLYTTNYGVNWTRIVYGSYGSANARPNSARMINETFLFKSGTTSIVYGSNISNVTASTITQTTTNTGKYMIANSDYSKVYTTGTVGNKLFYSVNKNFTAANTSELKSFTNAITGLAYTTNYSTTNSTQGRCIDSYTYCNNSYYSGTELICNIENTLNCNAGCYNDSNSGVAICSNTCLNTCNILGSTKCYDSTQVKTCDDYNGYGCYNYDVTEVCGVGSHCLESGSFLASCVNVTQNGTHSNVGLNIIPYTTQNENVSYNYISLTKTLDVKSIFSIHIQQFYSSGTDYISRTCDYSESDIYSSGFINISQLNNSYQPFNSALNTDGRVEISILPYFNDTSLNSEGDIKLISSSDSTIKELYYIRNSTDKSLCLLDQFNGSIVYCDYSIDSYDDLSSIDFEFSIQQASKTISTKVTFNRNIDNVIVINPTLFTGNDIFSINISSTSNPLILFYENIIAVSSYPSFAYNTERPITCQEYNFAHNIQPLNTSCPLADMEPEFTLKCLYNSPGNYVVRTYGNNLGIPDYSTYKDTNINILALGVTKEEIENAQNNSVSTLFSELPLNTKYWIMLIASLLALLIFTIVVAMFGDATSGVLVGLVISMIVSLTLTIIFGLSLLIPILYIIIGGAIVAILIRKIFAGG